ILPMEKRTGADLATAVLTHDASGQTPEGTPFAGFNNGLTGVWVMAVMCDSCSNPSPVILSVLQPTGQPTAIDDTGYVLWERMHGCRLLVIRLEACYAGTSPSVARWFTAWFIEPNPRGDHTAP